MATLEELGLQTRTQKTNGLDKLHRLGIGYINEELDRAPEPDYSFVPTPQKESPEDFSAIPLPQQKVKLQQRKDDTAEKVREYYSAPPTRFDKIIMGSDAAEMVFGDLATFGEIQPDTEERLNVLQKSGAKAAGSAWDLLLDGIGYASALAGRDDIAKNISEVKKRNLAPARLPSSRKEFDVSDLTKPDFWAEQAPATIALYLAGSTGGAIGGSAAASLAARAGLTEKAAQVAKFAGQIFGGTIPMTGAEAFMEASGTYNQALESMLQSGKSEKEAQEKASEVAANTFTSNLALLAGTNAFEYYTALGKLPRGVRNKFTRYVIDRAKGAGIQKGGRRAVFGALNIASKGAAAAAESAEEVIQGWVQKTAQDYVDGTKPDAGLEIKDLLTKIEEMKPDTQAEILVGLGMGLLFQAGGSFEEYSARRKKLERKAKTNPQELKRDLEKIVTEEEETKQAFSVPAQEPPAVVEPDEDEKALNEIAQQAYGKSLDDLPIEQRTDLEKRYYDLSEKAASKKIDDLISERVGLKKAKAKKPEKGKTQPPVAEAVATSTAAERAASAAEPVAFKPEVVTPKSESSPSQPTVAPSPVSARAGEEPQPSKGAPPSRARLIAKGIGRDPVRAVFPSDAHAQLFALGSKKTRFKMSTAQIENVARQLGLNADVVSSIAGSYNDKVREQAKGIEQGENFDAVDFKDLIKTKEEQPSKTAVVNKPIAEPSFKTTHKEFDRAFETFQEVAAKQTGKPVPEQSAAIAEELRARNVPPVIIDELTNPRRTLTPRNIEAERSATSRPERIARAAKPSPTLKPKVDAVAQANVDFRNKEAALLKAREEIKADIEARGGEVVIDTDTGAMTITLRPGKAKISEADQALIERLRAEAAEAGAYSLATVGQGFEISSTPERIADAPPLPAGDFKARALEFLKRNAEAKAAEKVFKQEKEDARNDLVDYYLAERAAGKETPSALLGVAKDGTKVEVMARRVRSAAEPDLAVGGRDFPKEIAEAKKQAKERDTETGEPYIETRKAGDKKVAQAKERGAFVAESQRKYGREDIDYNSWYSEWSKSLARTTSRKDLEKQLKKVGGAIPRAANASLRAIEKTTSMKSNSQTRAQTGNVIAGLGDKAIALRSALEIYDLFPEKTLDERLKRQAEEKAFNEASHKAADEWLDRVWKGIKALEDKHAKLLAGAGLYDTFRKGVSDGKLSKQRFKELQQEGRLISDENYAQALEVRKEIEAIRNTELVVPEKPASLKEQSEGYQPNRTIDKAKNPIFYSQLLQVVSNKLPNSGTAEQMLQAIDAFQKKGEFKKEEIEWVGLREWLQGKSGKVAKQEITDFVKEHQIEVRFIRPDKPKYKKHVLDGGRKYQEVLFVLPGIKGDEFKQFHSSNFEADEPIVAHVRLDERDTADGGRALFIEEIQSDWHQKGRERGYLEIPKGWKINKVDPNKNRYKVIADSEDNNKNLRKVTLIDIDEDNVSVTRRDAFRGSDEDAFKVLFSDLRSYQIINPDGKIEDTITGTRFNDIESLAVQAAIDISNGDEIGGKGVPNAPFKTTWHELAFKRMLRYAVDKGFDKIAWTTGEHQSERYDLSKRVSGIIWNTKTRNLYVKGTNGESIIDIEAVTDSELSDLVGKEMSNKILSGEPNEKGYVKFYGDDLSIGGEGMKGFYNKIIPEFVKKYTKKWGGEVSQTEIQTGEDEYATVHSLDITNAMRESVSKGQVLFESPAPYEPNYKKRPDVTPRTDRLAKEFMDALGKNRRRGRVYLANAIDASARENGQINLNGQRVRTTDDLAVVGQVARDPRVEQLRYVLVKDGKVIGSYMVGSRLPSATAAFPYASTKEGIGWLNGLMKDTGADGYYMLHNHPSGEVDTSGKEDFDVTETVSSRVEGFKGHVVIDSNVYATITRGKDGSLKKQVKQKFFGEDKLLKPSIDNPLIGRKAEDSNDLMAIGKAVQTPEGWATIIGTTPDSRIRGIAEVEEALLQIKGKRRAAIIRKFARDTGSAEVFLVADQKFFDANKDTLKKAVELGFIRDAVSSNGESIASQFPNLRKSNVFFGKEIEAGRLVKEGAQEIPDTITVNGKERPTRNSKGQLIHATQKGIENFWKWFGDSKVVDEQGRPLVVYHGSNVSFEQFSKEKIKSRFPYSFGFHFTSSADEASVYADSIENAAVKFNPINKFARQVQDGANVVPAYIGLKNPLVINTDQTSASMEADLNKYDIIEKLVASRRTDEPYDGVIIRREKGDEYDHINVIALDAKQIKSAIGNRGTFSPEEPSIIRESESTYGKANLNRDQFLDLGVKLNDFLQDKDNVDKLTEAERKEFAVVLGVLKEYGELSKKADLSPKEQRLLRIALSGLESKDGKRIISSVQKALEEGKPGWRDAINSGLEKIAEWSGAMKLWRLSSVAGSAGGNLFSSALVYPDLRLSAWFNKGIAKRSNVALTRFSDEARIHFKSAWMSGEIKNAAQQAIGIMKEKPGAESESKFLEREHIQKKAIKGWYGKYIRASYNAQGALDVLYRKPMEVGFIAVESFREGMKDSKTKIEGAKKGNVVARNILRVRELRDAGKEIPKSLEKYAKILQKAESDAEYRVFQSQLTGIAKKLGDFRRYPVVRILAPFYNTGMNILKQAYERTPLSAFQKEFMQLSEKHLKKTLTAEEAGRYSDRAAQITLGTLVSLVTTALLYAIADDDEELITGNYDPQTIGDKPLGWQPNSIRIGDTYVSTKMLQPFSTIFTAIGETMNNKDGYIAGGAKALADAYFVNPMTEEVFDVISAIRPGENKPLTKSAEEFFVDLVVGSATPGILNDIAKITDPVVRQKHGFFGRLRGKVGIPGASLSLPPRIDPFGEDLIPQTRGEKTVKTLTGLSFSKNKEDAARKELRSLGLNHDVESVTHKGVKLEPWEAIELNKSIGQRYREKILNLLQNPYYLSASVESRKKKLRMIRQGLIDKQKKYLERDPFFIERERSVRELKEAEKRLFKQMPE